MKSSLRVGLQGCNAKPGGEVPAGVEHECRDQGHESNVRNWRHTLPAGLAPGSVGRPRGAARRTLCLAGIRSTWSRSQIHVYLLRSSRSRHDGVGPRPHATRRESHERVEARSRSVRPPLRSVAGHPGRGGGDWATRASGGRPPGDRQNRRARNQHGTAPDATGKAANETGSAPIAIVLRQLGTGCKPGSRATQPRGQSGVRTRRSSIRERR